MTRVIGVQLQAPVVAALGMAKQRVAEQCNLYVNLLHTAAEHLPDLVNGADMVILDMASLPGVRLLDTAQRLLERCPFLRVVVLTLPLNGVNDSEVYFTLGALGVWKVLSGSEARRVDWWVDVWQTWTDESVSTAFRAWVEQRVSNTPGGTLVARMATHAHIPTVGRLADLIIVTPGLALASKRRRLWELCREYDLPAPELVHDALRLRLTAFLCERGWTLEQIARFMGYRTRRDMARSVKLRYGVSLRKLNTFAQTRSENGTLPELWDAA